MKELTTNLVIFLYIFLLLINFSCDSNIKSIITNFDKIVPPNDSTIVFVALGDNMGWHLSISHNYKKIYNITPGVFEINGHWSPDKKWLVFNKVVSVKSNNVQVWKMQFDGSKKKGIILTQYNCGPAKISPYGDKIVFTSPIDGLRQIMVCDSSGKNIEQITTQNMIHPTKAVQFFYPSWLPNGKEILFTFSPNVKTINNSSFLGLATINIYTKNVTFISSIDTLNPHHAQWSPVYDEIIFAGKGYPGEQIYIINSLGENLKKLTASFMASFPDFSSDGEFIVFDQIDSRDDFSSIWVMDRNGNNKRKLISIVGHHCTQPVW
ncbi:hypothetical protein H8E88_29475 [candidate division KSB1 bacterium]|nr:hypothetical protein [candidate division KSB1 bacterium]MBL7095305.1 hypothetical protein [candidate division KSB1 bacterium]